MSDVGTESHRFELHRRVPLGDGLKLHGAGLAALAAPPPRKDVETPSTTAAKSAVGLLLERADYADKRVASRLD